MMNVLVHDSGMVTHPAEGYSAESLMGDYPVGTCEVVPIEDVATHANVVAAQAQYDLDHANDPDLSLASLELRIKALEDV